MVGEHNKVSMPKDVFLTQYQTQIPEPVLRLAERGDSDVLALLQRSFNVAITDLDTGSFLLPITRGDSVAPTKMSHDAFMQTYIEKIPPDLVGPALDKDKDVLRQLAKQFGVVIAD